MEGCLGEESGGGILVESYFAQCPFPRVPLPKLVFLSPIEGTLGPLILPKLVGGLRHHSFSILAAHRALPPVILGFGFGPG